LKKKLILVLAVCVGLFIVPQVCAAYGIDQYTKLMIHSDTFDGDTVFTDSSSQSHTISAHGDVHHSTDQAMFGSSSMYFDGNGDYLSIPDSEDWNFGSEDFTIDFWVMFEDNIEGHNLGLFNQYTGPGNNHRHTIDMDNGELRWLITDTTTGLSVSIISGSIWSEDTWYHIAAVRSGDTFTLYQNGTSIGTDSDSNAAPNLAELLEIGWFQNDPLMGYLDEYRISKGIARWTDDFRPHTEEYRPTPIPGGLWLLGSGLIGLLGLRRKLGER
jgi:hypothetical protein